jgi:hypothetical protein
MTRLLANPALVGIGKVSYGLYVFHWPLIVWLTPERVGFGGLGLGLVRLAAAGSLATVSYLLVEHPIRISTWFGVPRHVAPPAVAACLVVGGLALLVPSRVPLPDAPAVLAAPALSPSRPAASETTTTAPVTARQAPPAATVVAASGPAVGSTSVASTVPAPALVAVFGDSIPAWLLRDAAPTFTRTDVVVLNGAAEACDGFAGEAIGRDRRGKELPPPDDCVGWPDSYPGVLAAGGRAPDAAVLMIGTLPTLDRRVEGVWHAPCDGIGWYLDDVAARVDWLQAQGVTSILAIPARPGQGATFVAPDDVGERIGCIRRQLAEFATQRRLDTIDLDLVLCPGGECDGARVDGVHVKPDLAGHILDWVLDRSLELIA